MYGLLKSGRKHWLILLGNNMRGREFEKGIKSGFWFENIGLYQIHSLKLGT